MTAKETILDFINLIFLVALIGFFILFFISGDNFAVFTSLMKALVPVSFFGILLLIKVRLGRHQAKKREAENNLDITLTLTYFDKIKTDFAVFSLPIVVLAIPIILVRKIDVFDIFQALTAFLIFYFWVKFLFKKEN